MIEYILSNIHVNICIYIYIYIYIYIRNTVTNNKANDGEKVLI